jgi:hypothetical protein
MFRFRAELATLAATTTGGWELVKVVTLTWVILTVTGTVITALPWTQPTGQCYARIDPDPRNGEHRKRKLRAYRWYAARDAAKTAELHQLPRRASLPSGAIMMVRLPYPGSLVQDQIECQIECQNLARGSRMNGGPGQREPVFCQVRSSDVVILRCGVPYGKEKVYGSIP